MQATWFLLLDLVNRTKHYGQNNYQKALRISNFNLFQWIKTYISLEKIFDRKLFIKLFPCWLWLPFIWLFRIHEWFDWLSTGGLFNFYAFILVFIFDLPFFCFSFRISHIFLSNVAFIKFRFLQLRFIFGLFYRFQQSNWCGCVAACVRWFPFQEQTLKQLLQQPRTISWKNNQEKTKKKILFFWTSNNRQSPFYCLSLLLIRTPKRLRF